MLTSQQARSVIAAAEARAESMQVAVKMLGAIGVSGGAVPQDLEIAEAGVAALLDPLLLHTD
jgi:uncharacterized protein GlcG (DUF336 family)